MKRYLLLYFFVISIQSYATPSQVSATLWLADIKLHLTKNAKKHIQEKVDGLTRSEKYFRTLLERANLYLPIVERVLQEENVPLDFKYLVLQESELMADAVSKSKAVGFWQFKEATAKEMRLKIDKHIDERMHIVAATRAAARYLKQHHAVFNNWVYALLAYNEGRGGVQRFIKQRYLGAKVMKVGSDIHVYLTHFLAYKVAFEKVLGRHRHPTLCLYEYTAPHNTTLSEIACSFDVATKQVQDYNKWLKHYRIPHHTNCAVIIPMTHQQYLSRLTHDKKARMVQGAIDYTRYWKRATDFPAITNQKGIANSASTIVLINAIPGVIASKGDNVASLAKAANLSLTQFIVFNDLGVSHTIIPGQVYYYAPKKRKAGVHFHIVRQSETWWSISQKYGITKSALLLKNRLHKEVTLVPGRVLWLRFIRPARIPIAYAYLPPTNA